MHAQQPLASTDLCIAVISTIFTLGAHAQRGLWYLVCVWVCLSDALYLRRSRLIRLREVHVQMALLQHGADFYKNGFSYKRFIQKLWRYLLTRDIL